MSISESCIRRPVMTTLITASLIVFGLFAYRLLAVSALPAVDFPTISITATLPGASPEPMKLGPISLSYIDLIGMGVSLVAILGVAYFLTRTRIGKATRAISDNPQLAAASMSPLVARHQATRVARRPAWARVRSTLRSPGPIAGMPASIWWTPAASNAVAIASFSRGEKTTPGACSPSRRVVSQNRTLAAGATREFMS